MSKEGLIKDMKIFSGIPPHDSMSNYCQGDNYFGKALRKKIDNSQWTWDAILEQARIEGRQIKPHWDK